jgi:hypothetical protein
MWQKLEPRLKRKAMKKLLRITKPIVLVVALAFGRNYASAISVNVGSTGFVAPTSGLQVGSGATLLTSLSSALSGPGALSGTLTSDVWANDGNNGLGGYTFTYQLTLNTPSSQLDILALTGWGNLTVNAGYNSVGTQLAPSALSSLAAGVIDWYFSALPGGGASAELVIQTGVTTWTQVVENAQDGSQATALGVAPIPDGGLTVACLGFAFVGVETLRRKLRK